MHLVGSVGFVPMAPFLFLFGAATSPGLTNKANEVRNKGRLLSPAKLGSWSHWRLVDLLAAHWPRLGSPAEFRAMWDGTEQGANRDGALGCCVTSEPKAKHH